MILLFWFAVSVLLGRLTGWGLIGFESSRLDRSAHSYHILL